MEDVSALAINGVLSAQSLRRILKNSPHLLEVAKMKKRPTKSPETSSLQPLKPKKRKLVKKHFKISTSSSLPSEVEEIVQLDVKDPGQALTIYTPPNYQTA